MSLHIARKRAKKSSKTAWVSTLSAVDKSLPLELIRRVAEMRESSSEEKRLLGDLMASMLNSPSQLKKQIKRLPRGTYRCLSSFDCSLFVQDVQNSP